MRSVLLFCIVFILVHEAHSRCADYLTQSICGRHKKCYWDIGRGCTPLKELRPKKNYKDSFDENLMSSDRYQEQEDIMDSDENDPDALQSPQEQSRGSEPYLANIPQDEERYFELSSVPIAARYRPGHSLTNTFSTSNIKDYYDDWAQELIEEARSKSEHIAQQEGEEHEL